MNVYVQQEHRNNYLKTLVVVLYV